MATPITEVRGIGASTAAVLEKHGFRSAEDLAAATVADIAAVPGFGESRAQKVKDAANDRLNNPPATAEAAPAPAPAPAAEESQQPAKKAAKVKGEKGKKKEKGEKAKGKKSKKK